MIRKIGNRDGSAGSKVIRRQCAIKLQLQATADLRREFQRVRYVVLPQALPPDLVKRCRKQAELIAQDSCLIERQEEGNRLQYRVVTGETIRDRWPELFALYNDPAMRRWIENVTSESPIFTSSQLQSAVNLNILDSTESVYRWHFDAVAYTALLYLTDVTPEDGGALELIPNCPPHIVPQSVDSRRIQLWPAAGTLLLMDGTCCYHHTAAMLRPSLRLSIPMVYPNTNTCQERPAGLDRYLYERAT
jgi:hypothetical protein